MTYNIQYYFGHETLHPRAQYGTNKRNEKRGARDCAMIWRLPVVSGSLLEQNSERADDGHGFLIVVSAVHQEAGRKRLSRNNSHQEWSKRPGKDIEKNSRKEGRKGNSMELVQYSPYT